LATHDDIMALPSKKGIVAFTAVEEVIAAIAIDDVIALVAIKNVIAFTAEHRIVASARSNVIIPLVTFTLAILGCRFKFGSDNLSDNLADKFLKQQLDCFGRYARSHQPHRTLSFSASIISPSRKPISLASRHRCGSILVKIHCQKALRHKSLPPTTLDFCKSPLLS